MATKGASHLPSAVLACEARSEHRRVAEARKAAEKDSLERHAGRSAHRFILRRRARSPYVPSSFPVAYGSRRYSPVPKYADGVRAGDYVTYFDPEKALKDHHDPCSSGSDYARAILYNRIPDGVHVGFVIATFQHFGRDGAPVQIALHSGVVLDKRPSSKMWIEESSGRGCDFDGECGAGLALTDLVRLLMEQDTECHYRRLTVDFARRLTTLGHDDEAATLALDTASRWGLVFNGRISTAGRTWWYAAQRQRGVEVLEDAMSVEQPSGSPGINIFDSTITGSSFAAGSHAQATAAIAASSETANVIAKVIDIVKAGRGDLTLSSDESLELDDALEVLEDASTSPEKRGAGFRVAVRSVLKLAGALLSGAAGNGTWEAFKALAG